jgi:2-(1,2-epoxy-1,2-dihydrophenyl)acetyl-CoA isomerase
MEGRVTAQQRGRKAQIVLDRPAAKNALTEAMLDQLIGVVGDLSTDDTTDVVVIGGAGTDFCSGSDVGDITAALASDAAGRKAMFETGLTTRIHPLMRSLMDLPQVVVASARGHAVGLGAAIVLAADLTVLSETIRLSLPQVALGHTVDHGESYLLPRRVGPARAMQVALLAAG